MRGKFITFEGIDGSGKTTQLNLLAVHLRAVGVDLITTREPGGTPLGKLLRQTFLETEDEVAPLAELLCFAADRAQHVETLIKPALATGSVVISDRYADATKAYQGAGRGFDHGEVAQVIDLATGGLKPDLTLFFDITVEEAIRRMTERGEAAKENRMDGETAEFYDRVRRAYLAIAHDEPQRFRVIDGGLRVAEIQASVTELVSDFLGIDNNALKIDR